jgi:hypothetical protein
MITGNRETHVFRVSLKVVFRKLVFELVNDVFYVGIQLYASEFRTTPFMEGAYRVFVELLLFLFAVAPPLFLPVLALRRGLRRLRSGRRAALLLGRLFLCVHDTVNNTLKCFVPRLFRRWRRLRRWLRGPRPGSVSSS